MNSEKCIGLDIHQATIVVVVIGFDRIRFSCYILVRVALVR